MLFLTEYAFLTNYRKIVQTAISQIFNTIHNIQGVTGGTDQTSGECSLGQTIPI